MKITSRPSKEAVAVVAVVAAVEAVAARDLFGVVATRGEPARDNGIRSEHTPHGIDASVEYFVPSRAAANGTATGRNFWPHKSHTYFYEL